MSNKSAVVFVLLGQSNAVGHGVPMTEEDKILTPLKNVFGLSRQLNQSFDNSELFWSGYTSNHMNLAEEQDHTYSVANCLARLWQDNIDLGADLPDLHIVHIAIGAQGVTDGYMWNPNYERKLVAGRLGTVDISLYPFTCHILSLVEQSIKNEGKSIADIQLHWRGGENDITASETLLKDSLKNTYDSILEGFYKSLCKRASVVLHRIVFRDRCMDLYPGGEALVKMDYINQVFDLMCRENENISVFDVRNYPGYISGVRGNGMFIDDMAHFNPDVNQWVATQILNSYL